MAETETPEALRAKFDRMIQPLDSQKRFAKGWAVTEVSKAERVWTIHMEHIAPAEPTLVIELHPTGSGPSYAQTNHFDVRHPSDGLSGRARDGIRAITHALLRNGF